MMSLKNGWLNRVFNLKISNAVILFIGRDDIKVPELLLYMIHE